MFYYLYLSQKKVSSPAKALSCAILAMVAHHASELEAKRAMEMPMWRLVLHLAKSVRMIVYSDLIFLPVTNCVRQHKVTAILQQCTTGGRNF